MSDCEGFDMRAWEAWFSGGNKGYVAWLDFSIKTRELAEKHYRRNAEWMKDKGVHDDVVKMFKEKFEKDKNKT